ncbi:SDR family oxidoreductase [Baekduia soli]|uniref:SDR family oxidoreductase n=1 Tax=Baekduia soli TaxID=496014 RepID=A0A5B8UC51_9ACTN|nr:SDR family oxidoreductase [Baekduia soli]
MARAIASENVAHGITINCVLPGTIATPKVLAMPPEVVERVRDRFMPGGRHGEPEEVAGLMAYLASPRPVRHGAVDHHRRGRAPGQRLAGRPGKGGLGSPPRRPARLITIPITRADRRGGGRPVPGTRRRCAAARPTSTPRWAPNRGAGCTSTCCRRPRCPTPTT